MQESYSYKSDKRYLSIKELALYLGIMEGTLYSWVCYKKIPYTKIGRLVKFDIERIDRWVQENAVEVMR